MDLDKSQKDPIACLQNRSSIPAISTPSIQQQLQHFQSCRDSNRDNTTNNNTQDLPTTPLEDGRTDQHNQNPPALIDGTTPFTHAMDSTYNYVSPNAVMAPNTFGDDEDFSNYDASLFGALPNEPLPFLADGTSFPVPLDLDLDLANTSLGTPPLNGFDGYLAGNLDFDESLLDAAGGLFWGADMYNQSFAMDVDSSTTNNNFAAPPPPSTASESQGLSPADNMYLPFTPPEVPGYPLSTMPSPSSATTTTNNPSPSQQPSRKPSSTGPKRQLRKVIKPETCPVCGKGHAQLRERDRHIVTHHYDDAVRMGLKVDRAECGLCGQTFRRKDHLTRHMKRRHGH